MDAYNNPTAKWGPQESLALFESIWGRLSRSADLEEFHTIPYFLDDAVAVPLG